MTDKLSLAVTVRHSAKGKLVGRHSLDPDDLLITDGGEASEGLVDGCTTRGGWQLHR